MWSCVVINFRENFRLRKFGNKIRMFLELLSIISSSVEWDWKFSKICANSHSQNSQFFSIYGSRVKFFWEKIHLFSIRPNFQFVIKFSTFFQDLLFHYVSSGTFFSVVIGLLVPACGYYGAKNKWEELRWKKRRFLGEISTNFVILCGNLCFFCWIFVRFYLEETWPFLKNVFLNFFGDENLLDLISH